MSHDPSDHAPENYDPFDEFNRAQGIGSVRDPYSLLADMRETAPVQPIDLGELLGVAGAGEAPPPDAPPVFMVLSHDAASEVLRDGERFSSRVYESHMGVVMGHTILEMDEPEHAAYRGIIQKAFTRRGLERWESELVQPVVDGHVDAFIGRGRADLVRELTFPFPVTVIGGMLGLPREDMARFHRWATELISVGFDWQRGLRASRELHGYLQHFVKQRRDGDGNDLISQLANAELDGQRLGDDEIIAFLRLLLPAGAETTYRSSSNLLYGLLSQPEQLEAVRADRKLVSVATEEGLRWEPPLTGIMREATRDTRVQGIAVPAGALLHVNLAAANRDGSQHPAPDVFDIRREPRQHMAFGYGAHRCLGMHLARMETRVVLEAVLDRLPGLRLDPEVDDVHVTGMIFRAPLALPVVFDN